MAEIDKTKKASPCAGSGWNSKARRMSSTRAWKGLETGCMPVFLGYDQTERMIAALLDRAERWRPEVVVGIARGGLVPATMAAGLLALPLSMVGFDRARGSTHWIGAPADARRVLLVDDGCSTGCTMETARTALLREG